MKTIIAGSRDFTNYNSFKNKVDQYRKAFEISEIISGGAKGVDSLAKRYALENDIKFTEFPADWDTHGKKAGPIRNAQMADYGECLLAVWDGSSKGTKNMIENMHKREKSVYLALFNIEITAN